MKNLYIKPILIGALLGAGLLVINLILVFGSAFIPGMGQPDGKGIVENPMATVTPTPPPDDTGFLIVLLLVNYVLAPVLIAAAGACSVWLSPADRLSPLRLLLVSALPGAVSMLAFTSAIALFSLAWTAGWHTGTLWFWLPTIAAYLLVGTTCSVIGGIICGIFSGKLKREPIT